MGFFHAFRRGGFVVGIESAFDDPAGLCVKRRRVVKRILCNKRDQRLAVAGLYGSAHQSWIRVAGFLRQLNALIVAAHRESNGYGVTRRQLYRCDAHDYLVFDDDVIQRLDHIAQALVLEQKIDGIAGAFRRSMEVGARPARTTLAKGIGRNMGLNTDGSAQRRVASG